MSGDLKTNWSDAPVSVSDLGGDLPTDRGGDPNVDAGSGSSGLSPLWKDQPVPAMATSESSNSQSGLPGLPSRFQPSGTPPAPPNLTDRQPGTVDQK